MMEIFMYIVKNPEEVAFSILWVGGAIALVRWLLR